MTWAYQMRALVSLPENFGTNPGWDSWSSYTETSASGLFSVSFLMKPYLLPFVLHWLILDNWVGIWWTSQMIPKSTQRVTIQPTAWRRHHQQRWQIQPLPTQTILQRHIQWQDGDWMKQQSDGRPKVPQRSNILREEKYGMDKVCQLTGNIKSANNGFSSADAAIEWGN